MRSLHGDEYLRKLPAWREAVSHGLYPPETVVLEPCVWRVLSEMKLAGKRCLDAGCGYGRFAEMMKRLGGDIDGIDISEEMVSAAVGAGIRTCLGDIEALPFKEQTFDFAFSSLVLMTLTVRDVRAAFMELHRVLKPRGQLLYVLVHPLTVCSGEGPLQSSELGRYREEGQRTWRMRMADDSVLELRYTHRPLESYFAAMRGLFMVTDIIEPCWSKTTSVPPDVNWDEEYYDCEYVLIRATRIEGSVA